VLTMTPDPSRGPRGSSSESPKKRRNTGSSGTAWRAPRAAPDVKMYTTAGAALATASP